VNESSPRHIQHEYDGLAGEYDEQWADYIAATTRETTRRLALRPGARLLDVGCGTGVLLEQVYVQWPGVRAVGIDLSWRMLAVARRRLPGQVSLIRADVGLLPCAEQSFDVVVSNSSFHYWPDPKRALAELARVLRPGGQLVLTDWCGDYITCRLLGLGLRLTGRAHERAYRSAECTALLRDAGYCGVAIERCRLNWFWGIMTARAARGPT
jgi:ubiquinone/menaquinone biosynthesis C-methylase UbiE